MGQISDLQPLTSPAGRCERAAVSTRESASLLGKERLLTEPTESTPLPSDVAPPLSRTFRYRWRMHLTLVVLLVAWLGAGLSPPLIPSGSLTVILADYFGWLMFFGGLSLRFWTTRFIGGRKSHEVVCYGPYSLTRNPLYVGAFLMILSLAFLLKSPTFAVATAVVVAYYCVAVVPLEERLLRHVFGTEYANYCASVPRWLPRVGTIYAPQLVSMNSQPMRSEMSRTAWWLLLPLLAELHTYVRAWPEWPHWLNLP